MHYVDLISKNPLIWGLFLAYIVLTTGLAYLGHRKTSDIKSFAVGAGDMNPIIVGITLAASIASTATFVINPGFVYEHGMAALMHYGLAAGSGVIVGLLVMSFGFRRVGARTGALTLPQWMGQRYESPAMAMFFSLISLLSLTFVVLIVGSLSIVMQKTLGLTNTESCALIIGFVFSYIFMGGTYAHAYTNTLQGIIMVFIAAIIVWSGVDLLFAGDVMTKLAAVNPDLTKLVNPSSSLYGSFFSVFVCGFIIGFAVVSQPHILIKALYVKEERDVTRYLTVCIVVSLIFTALLLVGLYAHLMGLPREAFINPATGAFSQDRVMTIYIIKTFDPTMIAVIMVALMAAGMSTLDGLLIALSSIAANDLFLGVAKERWLSEKTEDEQAHMAHRAGQLILIAMGVLTFFIALKPPKLLGIFGQIGIYGIVAASLVPLLCGILFPGLKAKPAFAGAIAALLVHAGLYLTGYIATLNKVDLLEASKALGPLRLLLDTNVKQLGLINPAVTATYGILVSCVIILPAAWRSRGVTAANDDAEVQEVDASAEAEAA